MPRYPIVMNKLTLAVLAAALTWSPDASATALVVRGLSGASGLKVVGPLKLGIKQVDISTLKSSLDPETRLSASAFAVHEQLGADLSREQAPTTVLESVHQTAAVIQELKAEDTAKIASNVDALYEGTRLKASETIVPEGKASRGAGFLKKGSLVSKAARFASAAALLLPAQALASPGSGTTAEAVGDAIAFILGLVVYVGGPLFIIHLYRRGPHPTAEVAAFHASRQIKAAGVIDITAVRVKAAGETVLHVRFSSQAEMDAADLPEHVRGFRIVRSLSPAVDPE